jgi:predicted acylesterase/phospholipase RssA
LDALHQVITKGEMGIYTGQYSRKWPSRACDCTVGPCGIPEFLESTLSALPNPAPMQDLVRQRREFLKNRLPNIGGTDLWGLALSGGGIRSATFCLGLLHALAASNLMLRFDLLSTVSGGGYIGATIGRLFDRAKSLADVDRIVSALADGNTAWFCRWLRANGRYLTPHGVADRFFAAAVLRTQHGERARRTRSHRLGDRRDAHTTRPRALGKP